jgi:sucrose-6-phosphate hydrolase SacC (GH32 family)
MVLPLEVPGDLFHIVAQIDLREGTTLTFHIHGATVTLTDRSVSCDSQPAVVSGGVKTVEILVDRTSVETFVNGGEVSVSTCFLPTDEHLTAECVSGSVTLHSLEVFPLQSIWKKIHK